MIFSFHGMHLLFVLRIYVEEKMWQCKADILRLEFLWHHGGVYVDADMISVGKKSLNPIVELGKVRVGQGVELKIGLSPR